MGDVNMTGGWGHYRNRHKHTALILSGMVIAVLEPGWRQNCSSAWRASILQVQEGRGCERALLHVSAGQQQQQPDPFKHIADEYRQIRAGKTHARLMDPGELPRRQQGVRRVDEGFWRQSTSSYAAPAAAKKKRKQTLERAPRKAVRIAKPGRQAVNSHPSALLYTLEGLLPPLQTCHKLSLDVMWRV